MINSIDTRIEQVRNQEHIGLMTHAVAGYPDLHGTKQLVRAMADAEVDFVELQIPPTDPYLDGPTIQHACRTALESDVTIDDAFDTIAQLTNEVETPLLLMSYGQSVLDYNIERFCADASSAGASGLIVPDMPVDLHEDLHRQSKANDLHTIVTIPANASTQQMETIAETASGFAYCMLQNGKTGAKERLAPGIIDHLQRARQSLGDIAISAGFGISRPEHLRTLQPHADVAVVGSAVLNVIQQSTPDNMIRDVGSFIRSLRM